MRKEISIYPCQFGSSFAVQQLTLPWHQGQNRRQHLTVSLQYILVSKYVTYCCQWLCTYNVHNSPLGRVDAQGVRNLDLSPCGVVFLIFTFSVPLGAITFRYLFSIHVIFFLILFIFKYQSGAKKATTVTSILNKSGFTDCQSTIWILGTGCTSAMELCTQSQSIVTNFISRTWNICPIHEDDVMDTCNFMKTPNLALHDGTLTCLSSYQQSQYIFIFTCYGRVLFLTIHPGCHKKKSSTLEVRHNTLKWKCVCVVGNSPAESKFDFSMGSSVPFPMKQVF